MASVYLGGAAKKIVNSKQKVVKSTHRSHRDEYVIHGLRQLLRRSFHSFNVSRLCTLTALVSSDRPLDDRYTLIAQRPQRDALFTMHDTRRRFCAAVVIVTFARLKESRTKRTNLERTFRVEFAIDVERYATSVKCVEKLDDNRAQISKFYRLRAKLRLRNKCSIHRLRTRDAYSSLNDEQDRYDERDRSDDASLST